MRREPSFEAPGHAAPFASHSGASRPGASHHADRHSDDPHPGDLRPLGRPRPFARARLAARFVLAAASIAVIALVARERAAPAPGERPAPRPIAAAPAPEAGASRPLLVLETAEALTPSDPPRWNAATGLREDGLTSGGFGAIEAPYLRVTMGEGAMGEVLAGGAGRPGPSLFVALARRAAEAGGLSVLRTGLRGSVETKFGRMETVELTLGGEGSRRCTGFSILEGRALRLDGWLCGVLGQAPEPRALACILDGLRLGAPATPTVETAFDEAERRRDPRCGQESLDRAADRAAPGGREDRTGSIAAAPPPAGQGRRLRRAESEKPSENRQEVRLTKK